MWREASATSTVVVCALGLASIVSLRADVRASRREAALLKQKVATINDRAAKPSNVARRITVTESEVNSYLVYEARDKIPVAVVDLDAVRKQKAPTSLLDPMNYLMGRLAVTAVGTLKTANGVGRIELESSSVGSVPIPKILLQEIVSYYSRSAEKPAGISLDDPFPLPARIREIQVDRGQAIIVQ